MDFPSHAVLGATTAILLTGEKTSGIALQGALLGVLPDLLGAPVTEGYHLVRSRFRVFSAAGFRATFQPGTTLRWERLPDWVFSYYQYLHSVWFGLLVTGVAWVVSPEALWWGPTMYLSHSFVDGFLHQDEPGRRFPRAIRPFWPAPFCLQWVQWSEIRLWGPLPLIPVLVQAAFWCWYLGA